MCSGGEATCQSGAECEVCGEIYGEPNPENNSGNKEYYICDGCDKWFEDENGTTEITDKSSVTVPATGSPEDLTDPQIPVMTMTSDARS